MTLDEAIAILSDMKIDIPVPKAAVTQKKRNVALDMAISALSCSEIPNSSDTISRQAALDIYDDYNVAVENGELEAYGKHRKRLLELPAAQPERKRGKWVAIDKRYVRCSECGLETTKNELRGIALFGENEPYFCPNCGADMRGMEDG